LFEPDISAHPVARALYVSLALVVGGVVVGAAIGALVAVLIYIPSVIAAGFVTGSGLITFGVLMGVASGAGIGFAGGIGALAGMISVRAVSHTDLTFILGSSVGAALGVLIASANLLVSRDGATWTPVALSTLCALFACGIGAWALTRHEHTWERQHRQGAAQRA
jgi:hypothetical protein